MDSVSRLLHMAGLVASLDGHFLLGEATRLDVPRFRETQVPFHVLLEGECTLEVGTSLLDLHPGDVVLIPSGIPHRLTTRGNVRPRGTVETPGDVFVTTRSQGGGTTVIDMFCGHYSFRTGAGRLLLRSLPELVHVRFGQSDHSDEVLRMLGDLMRSEARREGEGTAVILSALSTVLLAMVLRTVQGKSVKSTLWAAAAGGRVSRAVEEMLNDPGQNWTIDRLSRVAAMSRSAFLRHFTQETGMTVGGFLTRARLMAAADLLGTTDATVATIARGVGYQSESAFSRAFRTETGTSPARFRRDQASGRTEGKSRGEQVR
ncbi:transcriptional regulator [Streptomyces sulfonofaciens]|uniref:Transcriptional regulator n=1 Tax=Streptomyces sulfonofaciens TaxID=68272 RepID=A0A919KYX8_9ACTN|nr:AraC family transcriptional regulator [Streptomyces sulfonofaciens]GHH77802.1 transcriptional regulator [Streptomyces sulfonofaciens]